MQMIPPSDSLGRTADVFPSKWHSPTAVSTQLLTLCYFNHGLWLTQLDRQWLQWSSWLQARPLLTCTFVRMRKWRPSILMSLKNTPQVSIHPGRKLEKAISTSVVDLGRSTPTSRDTTWRVENRLPFGPYLFSQSDTFVHCKTHKTLYGGLDLESERPLYFWVFPTLWNKKCLFSSGHQRPS